MGEHSRTGRKGEASGRSCDGSPGAARGEAFVGIDAASLRHAVAVAEDGRTGEVRFIGEIGGEEAAVIRMVRKLAARYGTLTFCYEAGPTGYDLYRLIRSLGHDCMVVAPSLIPKKAGDRVKTNRRDALTLARLLRAGELTAVWVPDPRHEAMRDLTRAREAAVADLIGKRQQVSSLLLRLGRRYTGKTRWGPTHLAWLASLRLDHPEQRVVLEEAMVAVRQARERARRLEQAIGEALPHWSLAPRVAALMAMRGFDLVAASAFMAEMGDLSRFASARELMGYLGLTPCERSTGERVWRGGISKAGNGRARRLAVECAWSYRHPARVGAGKLARLEAAPRLAREIAWKAQTRLCARYRALLRKGKKPVVAITAVARELVGFIWALDRAVTAPA